MPLPMCAAAAKWGAWYLDGRADQKNTFTDFIACAEYQAGFYNPKHW